MSSDVACRGRARVPGIAVLSVVDRSRYRRVVVDTLGQVDDGVRIHVGDVLGRRESVGLGVEVETASIAAGGAIEDMGIKDRRVVGNVGLVRLAKSRPRGGGRILGSHLFPLRGCLLSTFLCLPGSFCLCLHLGRLGTVVLAHRLRDNLLFLGFDDGNGVGERLLGTGLALGVRTSHDLDLDTEHTLAKQHVAGGTVDEVAGRLARVDHETVGELHALGAGSTKLAGDDNLAALGTAFHNEAENTIAGTTHRKTVQKLVSERLALGNGRQTAVLNLGGIERDRVLGKLEALLDERCELADAATLLAENFLSVRGADDDVGDRGRDADLDARVALLGKLSLEEFVELGVEDAVGDELPTLRTVEDSQLVGGSSFSFEVGEGLKGWLRTSVFLGQPWLEIFRKWDVVKSMSAM
jgi:hypothetical protein